VFNSKNLACMVMCIWDITPQNVVIDVVVGTSDIINSNKYLMVEQCVAM
jgi:hypothetical protein